jgi:3-oxoacyl-[acyl-carrier protein] reductase
MVFDLTGSRALVTGAGSVDGIGFASARILAEMGCRVYLSGYNDRVLQRAEELVALGHAAHASTADLTDERQAAQLVANASAWLGGIDIVVNNAGMTSVADPDQTVTGETGDAEEMSPTGWRRAISRNLDTAFYVSTLRIAYHS